MKYRNCTSKESSHRQQTLEKALLAVMSEKNYRDITISDICSQAGLSRKSFYHYFDGKEGCLYGLIDHTIQNYHLKHDILPNGRVSAQSCLNYWKEHSSLLDVIYRHHMTDFFMSRIFFFATEENGFQTYLAGNLSDGSKEQALFLLGGGFTLVLNWHLSGYQKDVAELAVVLERLLDQALTPRPE